MFVIPLVGLGYTLNTALLAMLFTPTTDVCKSRVLKASAIIISFVNTTFSIHSYVILL